MERLAQAGIAVGIAVTPLMPMTDPSAFARRARESGIASLWVGRLRLLKDDPFYDLLARNRWLKVLDPDYAEEIREILKAALPPATKARGKGKSTRGKTGCGRILIPKRPVSPPVQPGLFEELG